MEHHWDVLEPFQKVLLSRMLFEPLPSPAAYSQVQHFGWITVDLPEQVFGNAPASWLSDWINKLHDGLRLFVLAASLDTDAWRGVLGVQGFPVEDLSVSYRFRIGSRLDEVKRLLRRGCHDQTAHNHAKQQLLRRYPSPHWPIRPHKTPVSLVISPDSWIGSLVDELIELWTQLHYPVNVDGVEDDTKFDFEDLQLHVDKFEITPNENEGLTKLLKAKLPISTLKLTITVEWLGSDVFDLVKAVDTASISSFKLHVSTSEQYGSLLRALHGVQCIKSFEIGVSTDCIVPEFSQAAHTSHQSSVVHLTWLNAGQVPLVLGGIQSLELNCAQTAWLYAMISSGSHLKALSIRAVSNHHPPTVNLDAILTSCPQLKALNLDGVILDGLEMLQHAYQAGRCQISVLALRRVRIVCATAMEELALALSNPRSIISQRLVEFVWLDPTIQPNENTLAAFATMLDTNYRLWLLELPYADPRMASHHLKRLPAHRHSLISVVVNEENTRSVIGLLSRDILQQIFEFADVGERRRVILHKI